MEKHLADPDGRGRLLQYTALELTVMLLKRLAASGDQRAFNALMALDQRHAPPSGDERVGYVIVPERLTEEEWAARYSPKEKPPPVEDDIE